MLMASLEPATPRQNQAATATDRFDGPLLFVHHDANHMKAAPHRHRIFSHVQRQYRPWKRRSDGRPLRTSPKPPTKTKAQHEEESPPTPSPTSLVRHGNSDPFRTYPVNIGAEENELISFYRDLFLPAQYGNKLGYPETQLLMKRDLEACMSGLLDESIAHGSLARWGYMVRGSSSRLHKTAMQHQLNATQLLRRKIASGVDLQTEDNYMHLNMLYSAETISRNAMGALTHGRMLRQMFEEAHARGTLNLKLLVWQFHNDVQTSSIFLVPPVFDVDHFLPMVFAPTWEATLSVIPTVDTSGINSNIDPSIQGPLLSIFESSRIFWHTLESSGGLAAHKSFIVTIRCNAQELLQLGRFLDHYCKVREQLQREISRDQRVRLLVEAYLSLAGIYLVKSLNLDPVVLGRPMFDMRPAVLPALRAALEQSELLMTDSEQLKYANSRFWALFVGAMSEHGWPVKGQDACRQWYNTRLADLAARLGLYTWTSARLVLKCFLYTDNVQPPGALWYDEMMSVNTGYVLRLPRMHKIEFDEKETLPDAESGLPPRDESISSDLSS
ncbi:uncharacterized protein HMPREF1541_11068 [Cyphellophora europaea CBS 101466]|uniref:Transcription factor domain-containing protein n=1 Tax=Cyphellophora europaea (strain CBS 101466) TaxID=1220924 RepID=W2S5I6_CYPE1|nr:uncharacterized protein HMPREF1541_11068 [Cyphellophora europaea CBS 101466]ETN43937.1 hypothetical protein HMPREF1541_11068 [Cyphellophora europaea CBS 101466]